ncbi:hypothetical protein ACM66B_003315 [Microbotryomycetes sp. NB124-2]
MTNISSGGRTVHDTDALIAKRASADAPSEPQETRRREVRFAEADWLSNDELVARDQNAMRALEKRAACPRGYVFVYSKRKCYKSKFNCGAKKCPINPKNGYWYCPSGPSCKLECQYGLTPNPSRNVCYNPKFDKNNCGATLEKCPFSYNGIGTRSCYDGKCKITCPGGYKLVSTPSGKRQYCKHN